ncbi:hypothetical protein F5Y16DRAFT_59708 [Xylariaceae sp. FL0255]|nr:hypothetical protein F5Y16DRAFT_59708 [Xylariaceae sp. FL0255]
MVSLNAVRASNNRVETDLISDLVAVFAGGSRGIGESAMKQFAKKASKPRIYVVGRTQVTGDRTLAELHQLNPEGKYVFLRYDMSLLRNIDELSRDLRSREPTINLLFITFGTLVRETMTEENLHYWAAISYYNRMRLVVNLIPQIQKASSLRRVQLVMAGRHEGPIVTDNFAGHKMSFQTMKKHLSSMTTVGLEAIQKRAPEVTFIHSYPGFVGTDLLSETNPSLFNKLLFKLMGVTIGGPIEKSGEYHLYLATSARFPPADGNKGAEGVPLGAGIAVAKASDGKKGGGVYNVNYDGENAGQKALDALALLRKDGTAAKTWKHTEDEFLRVTNSLSI